MVPEYDSDVVVGVDEADESGAPADRWGDVQESKDAHLEHDEPEEHHVDELDHWLSGGYKAKGMNNKV